MLIIGISIIFVEDSQTHSFEIVPRESIEEEDLIEIKEQTFENLQPSDKRDYKILQEILRTFVNEDRL